MRTTTWSVCFRFFEVGFQGNEGTQYHNTPYNENLKNIDTVNQVKKYALIIESNLLRP